MTCDKCGAPCQGRLCRGCALDRMVEKQHGVPSDRKDGDEWGDDGGEDA